MSHDSFPTGSSGWTPPLAALASRQHGTAKTEHLRAIGLNSATVSKWVARKLLHRRYPGVYTIGHTALSREGELLAAVFAGGDDALLADVSSTELWGVSRGRRARIIHVLVPRYHKPLAGIRFHQTRSIDPLDRAEFKGVPVTSVPRTLVDLSDSKHPLEIANVIHEAAFWNRLNLPAIEAAITRSNGRHHLDRLKQAIAYHLEGSAGFKSRNEERFFSMIERAGLPEPLVNVDFEALEIDFRWPKAKLAVEVDGSGHRRPRSRREDAAVDLALRASGYTVLRFTDADLDYRPDAVIAEVSRRTPPCR